MSSFFIPLFMVLIRQQKWYLTETEISNLTNEIFWLHDRRNIFTFNFDLSNTVSELLATKKNVFSNLKATGEMTSMYLFNCDVPSGQST